MNHEAITPAFLHPDRPDHRRRRAHGGGGSAAGILRARRQHHRNREREGPQARGLERLLPTPSSPGRSVDWDYEQRSRFNRRIHTLTDIKLSGPAARHVRSCHQVLAERLADARHGQQLRQRLHALGHVSDLRRELGRLLPPHRGDGQSEAHRQGADLVRALRRRGQRPRAVGHRHAGHRGQSLRPLERR